MGRHLRLGRRFGKLEELVREDGLQLLVGDADGLGLGRRRLALTVGFDHGDGLDASVRGVERVVLWCQLFVVFVVLGGQFICHSCNNNNIMISKHDMAF